MRGVSRYFCSAVYECSPPCIYVYLCGSCRRRLPSIMLSLRMAQNLKTAITFIEQGRILHCCVAANYASHRCDFIKNRFAVVLPLTQSQMCALAQTSLQTQHF